MIKRLRLEPVCEKAYARTGTEPDRTSLGQTVRFGVFVPPGFSQPTQIVVTWTYYFFQIMGRGLFPLLLYYAVLGIAWRPPTKQEPEQGKLTAARHHAVE